MFSYRFFHLYKPFQRHALCIIIDMDPFRPLSELEATAIADKLRDIKPELGQALYKIEGALKLIINPLLQER